MGCMVEYSGQCSSDIVGSFSACKTLTLTLQPSQLNPLTKSLLTIIKPTGVLFSLNQLNTVHCGQYSMSSVPADTQMYVFFLSPDHQVMCFSDNLHNFDRNTYSGEVKVFPLDQPVSHFALTLCCFCLFLRVVFLIYIHL